MKSRIKVHCRDIETCGYLREDGLWDIEGRLQDTKQYHFENTDRGVVRVGEPLHEMLICLTIRDDLEIVDSRAETLYAPFRICPAITDSYRQLIGLRIAAGFTREVKKRVGGVAGCTHITEIVRVLATVALQTIRPHQKEFFWTQDPDAVLSNRAPGTPDSLRNSCYAFAEDE